MNNYESRISEAKKKLQEANDKKIRLEEQIKSNEKAIKDLEGEMEQHGVTPESIEFRINELDSFINSELEEIEIAIGTMA